MSTITLLNAAETGSEFDGAVHTLAERGGSEWQVFDLAGMNIHFCTGCWSCWWKTPGRCVIHDDMETILPCVLASDVLMLATPVFLGLPAARMKQTLDRMIPLLHPYIELVDGECHHRRRYACYPKLALYADTGGESGDFEAIDVWMRRFARNFHGPVVLSKEATATPEEVADALAGL